MAVKVLSILAAISFFSYGSCNNNENTESARISWKFPTSRETKIGRQMPPHPEPDAVLVNSDRKGQPRMPEGNFPEFPNNPGVFNFPIPGGNPGVNRPRHFGVPDMFGAPRFPVYPNPFGFPGSQVFPANPNGPGMQGVPGIPNDPSMFMAPGQGGPLMPNGPNVYSVHVGQSGPGYTVRTGYFSPNGPPSFEPRAFEQPGVFAVAGRGNIPFSVPPDFFFSERGPIMPDAASNTPPTRGMVPETYVPNAGRRNDFRPGGMWPGIFYPEAPFIPNHPGYNSDGNSPGREFNGGPGRREVDDSPAANPFPLIEVSALY